MSNPLYAFPASCEQTLRALARLAVPMFGDYCAVDVVREDGAFARVDRRGDIAGRGESHLLGDHAERGVVHRRCSRRLPRECCAVEPVIEDFAHCGARLPESRVRPVSADRDLQSRPVSP